MLAYELFLKNDQRNYNPVLFNVRPIKKIFIKKKEISIDKKDLEHYGSKLLDDYKEIQNLWQMPLNTTKKDEINIPNDNTSPRQDPPYLIIEGEIKSNKEKKPVKITFTTKKFTKNELKFEYDLENSKLGFVTKNDDIKEQKHELDKKIALKIETAKDYVIEDQSLTDAYKTNEIISDDNTIKFSILEESLTEFCNYIKDKIPEKISNGNFEIYVLPIEAKEKEIKNKLRQFKKPTFKDSFGNMVSDYASGNTRTASFLSFNEDYFTIKYIQDEIFYKNLGIGVESLDKVELPKQEMFRISGFDWWFSAQDVPNFDFKRYRGGIFNQLYQNYKELSKLDLSTIGRINLHVTCFKPGQKKLEIMIDENLTMKKLERLFSIIHNETNIPRNVFEDSLIITIGRTTQWHNYINAVRAFLSENPVDSFFLMKIFTTKIQNKIFDWIKQRGFNDASEFFKRAWFCYKILTMRDKKQLSLDNNENFAYNVGKLAGQFFRFASKSDEGNKNDKNRYSGILTYTKYDKATLERIFKRLGWWFGLLPSNNEKKMTFLSQASEIVKKFDEMSDNNKDYSFFFYKGFFEEAGEKNQ